MAAADCLQKMRLLADYTLVKSKRDPANLILRRGKMHELRQKAQQKSIGLIIE
jgi:hypothetical protein